MTTGIMSRCPVHVDRSLRHSQAEECLAESNLTGHVEVWGATSKNPRPTTHYEPASHRNTMRLATIYLRFVTRRKGFELDTWPSWTAPYSNVA